MRIWIVIAVLAVGTQRLAAQTPEAAVEQSMRGYAAALKEGPPEAVAGWFLWRPLWRTPTPLLSLERAWPGF
jgi:hypothetical protein